MLTVVLLKTMADISFYYSFAGPIAVHCGASPEALILSMCLMSLCFVLSFVLRERGAVRFFPLLLFGIEPLLPGAGTALYAASAPLAVYLIYLTARMLYVPERYRQIGIFSLFWKLLPAIVIMELIFRSSQAVLGITVVMGMTMLVCSVLLMRSLRHDMEVYCQREYQLLNLVTVLSVLCVSLFLSSEMFLRACFTVLKTVYQAVMGLVVNILMYVIRFCAMLFGKLGVHIEPAGEMPELELGGAKEMFDLTESGGGESRVAEYILGFLGIAVLAAVLLLVFRRMASGRSDTVPAAAAEIRRSIDRGGMREEGAADSAVQRVRQQYRRFLRLCVKRGVEIKRCDTSYEINWRAAGVMDAAQADELRSIYINARYRETASKEDAARARELYASLRRDGGDTGTAAE